MFNAGQRVRLTGESAPAYAPDIYLECDSPLPRGAIGIVIGFGLAPRTYIVRFDDYPSNHSSKAWTCFENQIEPLEDQSEFKRFMERVLKPVEVNSTTPSQ